MRVGPGNLLSKATDHLDRGEAVKAEALIERFLDEVPEAKRTPELMVEYHLVSARLRTRKTELLDAVKHCLEALRLAEEMDDPGALAGTLRWLGHIHWRKGDYHMALEYLEQGVKKAKQAGRDDVEGAILTEMGNALGSLGDTAAARTSYKQAIAIFEPKGPSRELARALNNLGDSYMQRKDFKTAIELFERSKVAAPMDINMRAWGCMNKAEALHYLGNLEDAKDEIDEALPLLKRSGDIYGEMGAYNVLGVVYAKLRDWEEAEVNLMRAKRISKNIGMPVEEGKVLRDLGLMHLWKGDREEARALFEAAMEIFREHNAVTEMSIMEKDLETVD